MDLVHDAVTTFAPEAYIRRADAWLLRLPPGFRCRTTACRMWRGVCNAALNAMDRGRRVVPSALKAWWSSHPNAQAQQPSMAFAWPVNTGCL
jgi:hypothetical protein